MRKIIFALAAGVVAVATLAGCSPADETFTVEQPADAVVLELLQQNPESNVGDELIFESPIVKDGEPFGNLIGTMTTVSPLDAGTRPGLEERLLSAVFDFPDGQISVLGVSYYDPDETLLNDGETFVRAIVGGTGAYVGASGEVATTRNADNSYTHVLRVLK